MNGQSHYLDFYCFKTSCRGLERVDTDYIEVSIHLGLSVSTKITYVTKELFNISFIML